MEILLNGEKKVVTNETVQSLVKELNVNEGLIVIEINGEIVGREKWPTEIIKDGMNIEIVHFVGGG
jgi:sulfur carrier protein